MEEEKLEKPSLIGVITSPGEQFERLRQRPVIWGALGIITILFIIGTWLQSLGIEIVEMGGLTAEEAALVDTVTNVTIVLTAAIAPIIIILVASVIHLLIVKMARSKATFKQLFSMNIYIMFINAVGVVLNGILFALFGGGDGTLSTSLASYIDARGALAGLVENLEVFAIWNVILTAIGLEKVAQLSKGLAWTIAIAFFAVGVLFSMFGAAVGEMTGM
jgi:hypothetical protein